MINLLDKYEWLKEEHGKDGHFADVAKRLHTLEKRVQQCQQGVTAPKHQSECIKRKNMEHPPIDEHMILSRTFLYVDKVEQQRNCS